VILDGMLAHIKAGSPFLIYPRFVQLFLADPLEGVPKPQDYILMRGNCTRLYLSRDLEKLTTPTRQCT
jgi:hypothetical protein